MPSDHDARGVTAPDLAQLAAGLSSAEQLTTAAFDRFAMAHDASHFLMLPSVVVVPQNTADVSHLMRTCTSMGLALTLRSGGTSLSGQSVTDGVLADVRRHFRGVEILDNGARVRVGPGVTVRQLNARLAPYRVKFGPDPASEVACTVGGVVANNSSGMTCGITDNSYQTLESVVAVLPSGTVIDTGAADASERLRLTEPDLFDGLVRLRDRVRSNPASLATIERLYTLKNTMGYGLNSFRDYSDPADILTHLIVGSEGTLAFIASATFRTVPTLQAIATTLMVFPNLTAANQALPALTTTSPATIELMDATALRVGQVLPRCPEPIADLHVDAHAALLVEYQAESPDELKAITASALPVLRDSNTVTAVGLTTNHSTRNAWWKLRKGLFAAVAGARPAGSTALLEDIAVPVPTLANTCDQLATLFQRYDYRDSVIFGHAKDGNIHFMLTDSFTTDDGLQRYSDFTEDMVDLVLANGGNLKAEHGTGRVMAPYLERQVGTELFEVNTEIKRIFDPTLQLNPGVLISHDPVAHLQHIKITTEVEEEVDRCVECGYCEPVCPSRDLTLTPRQRITLRRDIQLLEERGDTAQAKELVAAYDHAGVETCAADGLCQSACPVGINTGDLVRRLRQESITPGMSRTWTTAGAHWSVATRSGSLALTALAALPPPLRTPIVAVNTAARRLAGNERIPLWTADLPRGGRPRRRAQASVRGTASAEVVAYFPACVGSIFGSTGGAGVQASFESLCTSVGITLRLPGQIDSLCCGTPWSSKGVGSGYAQMSRRLLPQLHSITRGGQIPLICDASSCTEGLLKVLRTQSGPGIRVVDVVSFVAERIVPQLGHYRKLPSVTLHPTCSSAHLGIDDDLATVAAAVAHEVHVPYDWGCCAFAGDRGLLHPELTASATKDEAAEVTRIGATHHASCNRTCEIAMTRTTSQTYRHIVELLAEIHAP